MKSLDWNFRAFWFMFFQLKFIAYLIVLLGFVSCRNQSLQKFEPFFESAQNQDLVDNGTSGLWEDVHDEVLKSRKPRALLLNHGEEALILRINLIRSAKESISIQTFSWEFDEVGKFILWELIRANQEKGVKVKLLIDHMFNEHQPEMIAFLSTLDPNFEIKYFINICYIVF